MPDDASTWTPPEMQRAIERIEAAVIRIELNSAESYVRRDVYVADQRALDEWKRDLAMDVVNLEAEATRIRRDHNADIAAIRTGQRWALGIAVSGVGVMVGMLAWVVDNIGLGA